MKKEATLLVIFLISFSFISAQPVDSAWGTFHGNNQRTGLSHYDTSHIDGTVKWKFKTGDGIESSPTIDGDGTIYVGSHDGYLYAINPDGTQKWKVKIGTPIEKQKYGHLSSTSSTPAIAQDGTIYLASRDQSFYAIDKYGKIKWKYAMGISFDSWASPVIGSDGTIYMTVSPPKGGLYAFNPDGSLKWKKSTKTRMFNSPTLGKDGTIYTALPTDSSSNKLFAYSPQGNKKWEVATPLFLESSPALANDGTIYLGSFIDTQKTGAGIYAIKDQKIKWTLTLPTKEVMSTPAIGSDGTIYFGDIDGVFYAVSPTGKINWKYDTGKEIDSSPAIGKEGTIYFGSNNGYFYALTSEGKIKWKYLAGSIGSSPAIGKDGTVYIGSWDGYLYAFGSKPKIKKESYTEKTKKVENQSSNISQPSINSQSEKNIVPLPQKTTSSKSTPPTFEKKPMGFFDKIIFWFKNLFQKNQMKKESTKEDLKKPIKNKFQKEYPKSNTNNFPEKTTTTKKPTIKKEVCLTNKEYSPVTDLNAPVLSLPFKVEDYSTKYWGIVPFCAKIMSGQIHGAFDFELKPDTKIYAAESGTIERIQVGKEEGSGEILNIRGNGFNLDYSGLKNIQVKVGDKVKKGDYLAQAVLIPHGEHHLHIGLTIDDKQECPIKYMDAEFKAAFEKMFAQADYRSQSSAPCACNCESMVPSWKK